MPIASISGIRGTFGGDLLPEEVVRYAKNFTRLAGNREVLLGMDTRTTGPALSKIVASSIIASGADVTDYGILSTPALFRESRLRECPAMMITASHNEPDWNGLKFITAGRGINQEELDRILPKGSDQPVSYSYGRLRAGRRPSYNSELISMVGEGACQGVKVVLDLNGGAAIGHAPQILRALGCEVFPIGDAPGFFTRTVDPTNDPLQVLSRTVKKEQADVGFAFDCDGDRLVVVDNEGTKRGGDYMLTLAIKELLPGLDQKDVVVSVDTTQAVDDVVKGLGGRVFRSRVGESNVIGMMTQKGVRIGGEGSSGGLIDASFNYCRDSLLAATKIVAALKKKGPKIFAQVKTYQIARLKVEMPRKNALVAIKKLQKENPDADMTDGLKVGPSERSWVLVRVSGTEDVVRASAEAASAKEAEELAKSYLAKIKRLGA